MSAKYKCDDCGAKMIKHQNVYEDYIFIDKDLRVQFIVDFNQWTTKDVCDDCGAAAIVRGVAKLEEQRMELVAQYLRAEKLRARDLAREKRKASRKRKCK